MEWNKGGFQYDEYFNDKLYQQYKSVYYNSSNISKKMSITQTATEQIHLLNIITFSQDRLQSNFKSLLSRLKTHDSLFQSHSVQLAKTHSSLSTSMNQIKQETDSKIDMLGEKIEKCMKIIGNMVEENRGRDGKIAEIAEDGRKRQREIGELGSYVQERVGQNRNMVQELGERLDRIQSDVYKAYEQILKKQDSTQVLKISRDVDNTKQKISQTQKEYKLLEHKLQKIQILNQKTQRNQSKKQIQLMKQIEDRIRKQMKNLQKNLGSTSRYSSPIAMVSGGSGVNFGDGDFVEDSNANAGTANGNGDGEKFKEVILGKENRLSFKMEEEDIAIGIRNNFQKIAISKINQKLQAFENKIKFFQNSLNNVLSLNKKNHKPESQQIKQKVNEIRPQLIKLWAKCDTLDDRILFNERKIEQKSKLLGNLLDTQKQNGVGRLDQKFKAFQTEIYANLKQLKTKVETKVNSQDYQKQTMMLDDRLKQISQIIFQKSDKLQVKKALLFLQSKIKQIILVISEDQQIEKDALLTKKQLKCMSCDKDIDKMAKFASTTGRGNWDALPTKDHSPEILGKFGMTGFGSLSKKLKKLQSKDLPVLKSKKNGSSILQPIVNTIPEGENQGQSKIDK